MAITAGYRVVATHPTGAVHEMDPGTQKGALVYAQRAALRGYDAVIFETITKDGETETRTFLEIPAEVKPPFGDAWEKKAAAAAK